jgi:hypothetical protein
MASMCSIDSIVAIAKYRMDPNDDLEILVRDILSAVTILGLLSILLRELADVMSIHLTKRTKHVGIILKDKGPIGRQRTVR